MKTETQLQEQNRNCETMGGNIMEEKAIYITQIDIERLRALIEIYNGKGAFLESLEEELDRAHIIGPKEIPSNVVTMNSVVRIKDLNSGEEKTVVLVFPEKVHATEKAVSILAPIGAALIGQREGDVIEWHVPAGPKRLQVMEIIYQPERVGNYDL